MMARRADQAVLNPGDIMSICNKRGGEMYIGFLEYVDLFEVRVRGFDMKLTIIPTTEILDLVVRNWSVRPYKLLYEVVAVSPRTQHRVLRLFEKAIGTMVKSHPDVDKGKYIKACLYKFNPEGVEFLIVCNPEKGVSKTKLRSDILLRVHQMAETLGVQIFCRQMRPDSTNRSSTEAPTYYDAPLAKPLDVAAVVPEAPSFSGKPRSEMGGFESGPRDFRLHMPDHMEHRRELWHVLSTCGTRETPTPTLKLDFRFPLVDLEEEEEEDQREGEQPLGLMPGKDPLVGRVGKLSLLVCNGQHLPVSFGDSIFVTVKVERVLTEQGPGNMDHVEVQSKTATVVGGRVFWNEILELGEVQLAKDTVLEISIRSVGHSSFAMLQFGLLNLVARPDAENGVPSRSTWAAI